MPGRCIIRALSGALTLVLTVQSGWAEGCFTQADNARLSYRVFQAGRPPILRRGAISATSPYYPASDFATQNIDASRADRDARVYFLQWANRCIFMQGLTPSAEACRNMTRPKGNSYNRMRTGPIATQVRASFSTYDKANGCTILQSRFALGAAMEEVSQEAGRLGLTLFTDDPERERMLALADTVTTGKGGRERYLVDLCVLPQRLDRSLVAGVFLDYEVWDDRSPAEAVAFLGRFRELLRREGLELVVNTNPLPRAPNGITASSARQALAAVDGLIATVSSGATSGNEDIGLSPHGRRQSPLESYRAQLDVLTDGGRSPLPPELKRKLFWSIGLYDTSLAEAGEINDLFRREGYAGIMIFRAYVKQGGPCSREANQLTACLTMGDCSGRFAR